MVPTWKDVCESFERIPEDKRKLGVLIGGENSLIPFFGFKTIGAKYQVQQTVEDVLRTLHALPQDRLHQVVPSSEYSEKFGIGFNQVFLTHYHKPDNSINSYWPEQDWVDGERIPADEKVLKHFEEEVAWIDECKEYQGMERELIKPGEAVIMEILDGSCLLDEVDYLLEPTAE